MSDFLKLLGEYFKTTGRLSQSRYSSLMWRIWVPFMATLILESLIVDVWELENRLPHLLFAVRAVHITINLFLLISLPCIATRRLHDVGKSGWWSWLLMVLLLSSVTSLEVVALMFGFWLIFKDGDPGKNKYGDPPPDDD